MRDLDFWLVDFEYRPTPDGVHPWCMVAIEYRSGKTIKLWRDELLKLERCPFELEQAIMVAYSAQAELSCFLALGWPFPGYILDLCAEFKMLVNYDEYKANKSLLDALHYHDLEAIESAEKKHQQELAINNLTWSEPQKKDLIDYCESDVIATKNLLSAMFEKIDLASALKRGAYTKAVAKMEKTGLPLDATMLNALNNHAEGIKKLLIEKLDKYKFYEDGVLKRANIAKYVAEHGILWPKLKSGQLNLQRDIVKARAEIYPEFEDFAELYISMAQLRGLKPSKDNTKNSKKISVGEDGRHRFNIWPFSAKTGRNAPRQFIFNCPSWMRGLIKPEKGRALAYIDYSKQEFGIAAALSRDENMLADYRSPDPYIEFAKAANAITSTTAPSEIKKIREKYKETCLGVQFGMGAKTIALRLKLPYSEALALLNHHKQRYSQYWSWSDIISTGQYAGDLTTNHGWVLQRPDGVDKPNTLRNFMLQAHGADMLRLACILIEQDGEIELCAPVHDALMIESSLERIHELATKTSKLMEEASRFICDDLTIKTDAKFTLYPNRYSDGRGSSIWNLVKEYLKSNEARV